MRAVSNYASAIVAASVLTSGSGASAPDSKLSLPNVTVTAPAAPVEPPTQNDSRSIIANTEFLSENGQHIRLGDYRGKVVLVYFWGSWCPT
jgi:thiol-disulfide isomerase/thioredoxin